MTTAEAHTQDRLRSTLAHAREHGWQLQVHVDVSDYTGKDGADMRWCDVSHVSAGDGSPYPIKGSIPGKGNGQWRVREVCAWRERRADDDLPPMHLIELDSIDLATIYYAVTGGLAPGTEAHRQITQALGAGAHQRAYDHLHGQVTRADLRPDRLHRMLKAEGRYAASGSVHDDQ